MSLARAEELEITADVVDRRYQEPRFRAYGLLDGRPHCLAFTLREGRVCAISLRRVHRKEYERHVPRAR